MADTTEFKTEAITKANRAALEQSLLAVLGREHLGATEVVTLDRVQEALLIKPGSAEEVARCLAVCREQKAAVVPSGLGSWLDCGNPVRRADAVVSLERLNRVIEYSPSDLTITVEAGLTLDELNRVAQDERQWLPLDPAGGRNATLGAVAACASSGPLRFGFGTPRDYVLGLRLAHADGTESRSGGRVVKNVAGYDMNKLYVGSYGTLAVLTELTVKLRPAPETMRTVCIAGDDLRSLLALAERVIASELQPASVFVTSNLTGRPAGAARSALLVRFAGDWAAVDYQVDYLVQSLDPRAEPLTAADAESAWAELTDLDGEAETSIRLSVPLSSISIVVERVRAAERGRIVADAGAGIIRISSLEKDPATVELIGSLRKFVESIGGSLFVERAAPEVKLRTDAWGSVGAAARIMRDIKRSFDPDGLLNQGRFAAGI
ncbi:MAG TPA: FAD-binding oxidoreductase [Blastocatellia bacterium]|nr:FAD-binding oxidoreductase [Blastocatellia bacterium]